MNPKAFSTLDYDQIRHRLMDFAMSYLGRRHIEAMSPVTDVRQIESWLAEAEEALSIISGSSSVPIPSLKGIDALMKALNKGQTLNPDQISEFAQFLDSTEQLRHYMTRKTEIAPRVSTYVLSLVLLDDLREEIGRCVHQGEVLDSASDELTKIRKQISILEDRVRRKIEAAVQKYRAHLQETFYSQRDGRYALPVKRDSKRVVKGTILDESASGQTMYIEPEEVAIHQEELAEARIAEEREVSRVLGVLTGWIERYQGIIARNLEIVGYYDFLFAKAKLAKAMGGRSVRINTTGRISIRGARHPLLGSDAQPLDFSIGDGFRALIITGPNTGGKTVTLKTVGLLSLMAQSGLLVPVENDSELTVFHQVLADIGDGQSIDQSLSTFSAHVMRVIDILQSAGPKCLVLLDELASGTDPGEGIGLSIAVLESLYEMGATIVATTHFNEIKQFADATLGFENARMEFDTRTLHPLYRLRIGEHGESYALIIAENLGVPKDIVQRARSLVSGIKYRGTELYKVSRTPKQSPPTNDTSITTDPAQSTPKCVSEPDDPLTAQPRAKEYRAGDRVWIHSMKCSGIFVGPADDRGNVVVMVKKQRRTINEKRIAPYLSREELYPDVSNYDLDIVLESKDVRRKRKIMAKRHVEGLYIEHPTDGMPSQRGKHRE